MSRISPYSHTAPIPEYSAAQLSVAAAYSSFTSQSTDIFSIASMTTAGLVGRVARVGLIGLFRSSTPIKNFISHLGSIAAEATTTTLLQNGNFASHCINFSTFRFIGAVTHHHNPLLQHFSQSLAMMLGHHAAASLEFEEHSSESLAQQFFNASISVLQIQAGNLLGNKITGHRLQQIEKNLEFYFLPISSYGSTSRNEYVSRIEIPLLSSLQEASRRISPLSREIYNASRTLRSLHDLPREILSNPVLLMRRLKLFKQRIEGETKRTLTYLQITTALLENLTPPVLRNQRYTRMANAMDLHEESPKLKALGENFKDRWRSIADFALLCEQLTLLKLPHSRATLLDAFCVGDEHFPIKLHAKISRWATAYDYLLNHPALRGLVKRLNNEDFENLFEELIRLKTSFRTRGEDTHLGTILTGLAMHKVVFLDEEGISKPIQTHMISYGDALNEVYENWHRWEAHYDRIETLPIRNTDQTTRLEYARENLSPRTSDDRTWLNRLIRMGLLMRKYHQKTRAPILHVHTSPREGSLSAQQFRAFLTRELSTFTPIEEENKAALALGIIKMRRRFVREVYGISSPNLEQERNYVSLNAMGNNIRRMSGKYRSLSQYGAFLDLIISRWSLIHPHLRRISAIRKPCERDQALQAIFGNNQEGVPFNTRTLACLWPWIQWAAAHHQEIGLK